jgi:hypothetical protein
MPLEVSFNKVRVVLRDCPPTLHSLKCSFPTQMGISAMVEVPSLPYRTSSEWFFMNEIVAP